MSQAKKYSSITSNPNMLRRLFYMETHSEISQLPLLFPIKLKFRNLGRNYRLKSRIYNCVNNWQFVKQF